MFVCGLFVCVLCVLVCLRLRLFMIPCGLFVRVCDLQILFFLLSLLRVRIKPFFVSPMLLVFARVFFVVDVCVVLCLRVLVPVCFVCVCVWCWCFRRFCLFA